MTIEQTESGRSMVRYLLHEMTEAERVSFEERYLNDSEVFHELVEVETDLIDLYALGELSPTDRERLERSFLTEPERRRRLALAKSLNSYSVPDAADLAKEETNLRTWKFAWTTQFVAAALVVALPLISWLLFVNRRLSYELGALRRDQTNAMLRAQTLQQQIEDLHRKLEQTSAGQAQVHPQNQLVASFTLHSDLVRGNGEAPKLNIPSAAATVRLNLIFLADSFSRYDLALESADGAQIWRETDVGSHTVHGSSKQISVPIPSHTLKSGDYVVRITTKNGANREDVAAYSFQVLRR